jgi:hypothetical protein
MVREVDMPVHLEPLDVAAELAPFDSVLLVACPVCPPVSLALQEDARLIEFFRHGIRTQAFEDYVRSLRDELEQGGKRTGVFRIYRPLPMMCLWTEGQRRRLRKRARGYEAVLVLGCDSATHTVKDALKGAGCRVLQSMRMTGLSNATAEFGWPLNIELKHGTDVPVP